LAKFITVRVGPSEGTGPHILTVTAVDQLISVVLRMQRRSDSVEQPILSAIEQIASQRERYFASRAKTIRRHAFTERTLRHLKMKLQIDFRRKNEY
jgi:hypothetical protein